MEGICYRKEVEYENFYLGKEKELVVGFYERKDFAHDRVLRKDA